MVISANAKSTELQKKEQNFRNGTGKQDEEQGPGSEQTILAIQVQRTMSVSQEKQERNKTQTLTRVTTAN